MTTAADMRTMRDAIEQVVAGGLPTWYDATTVLGDETMIAAKALADKYKALLWWRSEHEEAARRIDQQLDDARSHADVLTRQVQALEAEIERLRKAAK